MTTNLPAEKGPNALVTVQDEAPEILRGDLLIPHVILAQAMSDFVQIEKKAQPGDIVRTTTREILGNPDKPIEVIFLHYPVMDWVVEKKEKGKAKFEFHHAEPRNASNETLPWSFYADSEGNPMEQGQPGALEWKRTKRLRVFALLPADIVAANEEKKKAEAGELPDVTKALTPVMLSFKSMGYMAGREVCTFWTQAKSMGVQIWRYKVKLGCTFETNDEGSFYKWNLDRVAPKAVEKDDLNTVAFWAETVTQNADKLRTDEGADSEGGVSEARPAVDAKAAKDVC